MKHTRWLGALVLLLTLLPGCQTTRVGAPAPEAALPPATAEVAEKAERDGDFVIAAREYDRLAQAAKPPQRQNFQLRSAEVLLKAGQLREARQRLDAVRVAGLDPSYLARRQILEAHILSQEGSHEKAIRLLDDAQQRARNLNPSLLAQICAVRAQAELALDNPIGAARNLIQREQYIVGKDAVADNQMQLWNILNALPRARLKSELDVTRDPVLSGWIELAMTAADNGGNAARMSVAIAEWKKTYPNHPANDALLTSIASAAPGLTGRIERVALLVPLTSGYAVAAQSVRDGFLAMDQANSDPAKPTVRVYDTGADPAQTVKVYGQAVADGAQLVVGPLGRDAADAVAKAGITVPTLILSHIDGDVNGPSARYLFQFGLPPEQEARQAAERAYLDGQRQAAILYPKSSWGERMEAAFASQWQRLGGIVLSAEAYNEEEPDNSESIKRLLNIAQSEARKALVETAIGQKVEFEVRARHDLDAIFLVADARHGRLLKPQLNFYHAVHIPVYATSNIYAGKNDPVHDVDLDGVMFADMPWMLVGDGRIRDLRDRLQHGWPYAHTDLDRLYALGVDSYAIIPNLNRIATDPGTRFDGVTSGLSLDRDGKLRRQLTWAQFSRGVARLVDTAARLRGQLDVESPGG
jgi:outer membrane PBP1 activator LpoA protein